MATVLLGWELGGGLGHVRPLLRIARELASHGHRPVLAVKHLVEPWPVFCDEPFTVLQAPFWHPRAWRGDRPFVAGSYADILAIRGYTEPDDLLPMVRAWQALIDLVRPDLIVADHSPTLCLTAYRALPVVVVGNGFTVPPIDQATFPPLLPGQPPVVPPERLLATVQEVQRRRGRPAPQTLPGLFDAATERFVCTVPELDPYRAVRREPQRGPRHPLPAPSPPPARPGFFAYLTAEAANAEYILTALVRSGCPGRAYLRGATPALRERLRQPGLEVLDSPPPLAEVLPTVSVVVHHASLGTAHESLAAGRPQLLLPQFLEQTLTARLLHELGVGLWLRHGASPEVVTGALRLLLSDPSFMERAQARAQIVHASGPHDPMPQVIERCLVLLGKPCP